MSETKKISRRKYIVGAGVAAAAVAAGAAAYYYLGPGKPPAGPVSVDLTTYHAGFWKDNVNTPPKFDLPAAIKTKDNIDLAVKAVDTSDFIAILNASFTAGSAPDYWMMWGGKKHGDFVKRDLCLDLTSMYDEYGWTSRLMKPAIDAYTNLEGKTGIWGVAELGRWEHYTYNYDLLEQYDLLSKIHGYPVGYTTYKEWTDICDTLRAQANVGAIAGAGASYGIERTLFNALERRLGAADTRDLDKLTATLGSTRTVPWTDSRVIDALHDVKEWWDKGYFCDGYLGFGWDEEQAAISTSKAAFIQEGIWEPGYLENTFPDFKYGVLFHPTSDTPSKVRWPAYYEGFGVTKTTKKANEVGKCLDYFLQDDVSSLVAKTLKEFFFANPKANSQEWVPAAVWEMSKTYPTQPLYQVCHTALTDAQTAVVRSKVTDVMTGATTPEDAAAALEENAVQLFGPLGS